MIDCCPHCQREKLVNKLKYGLFLIIALILSGIAYAPSGSSEFFDLQPSCTTNFTAISNCTRQTLKMNCFENNEEFVSIMDFVFNSTDYLAIQDSSPPFQNFSAIAELKEINETSNFVYNWSSVGIFDTQGILSIYPQNILVNHSCPDCIQNITQIISPCGNNDLKNITYNDTNQCTYPLPANSTEACDFCTPDFQCSNFSICTTSTKYKECFAIGDTNNCYAQTGLTSDNFTGTLNDFKAPCTFNDFLLNQSLSSSLSTELIISDYPYVETNTTVSLEVIVRLENTKIQISNVQMQLANLTIPFTFDTSSYSYKKSIVIHEVGDFPFTINGRDNATQVFMYDGMFLSRLFADVSVELFEDRNMTNRYENDLAYVVGIRIPDFYSQHGIDKDLNEITEILNKVNLVINKFADINLSTYYSWRSGERAIHAQYLDGIANLEVPIESDYVWELRLLNGETNKDYMFERFNYGKIWTKDATNTNDIKLVSGKISEDTEVKLLVSKWDIRFFQNLTKWGIFLGIVLIFVALGYLLYAQTNDVSLVVKLAIALIGSLPILFYILSWLFN